jgi:hypothetical protein
MSRVATLSLVYSSNLSQQKAEWDSFRSYVEANPIRTTYTGAPGKGPNSTFGGAVSDSGMGSISTVGHPLTPAQPPTVNNYYYGTGGVATSVTGGAAGVVNRAVADLAVVPRPVAPASIAGATAQMINAWAAGGFRQTTAMPQMPSMRMRGINAPGMEELFGIEMDNQPVPQFRGGRLSYNPNRSWTGGPRSRNTDFIDAEFEDIGPRRLGYNGPGLAVTNAAQRGPGRTGSSGSGQRMWVPFGNPTGNSPDDYSEEERGSYGTYSGERPEEPQGRWSRWRGAFFGRGRNSGGRRGGIWMGRSFNRVNSSVANALGGMFTGNGFLGGIGGGFTGNLSGLIDETGAPLYPETGAGINIGTSLAPYAGVAAAGVAGASLAGIASYGAIQRQNAYALQNAGATSYKDVYRNRFENGGSFANRAAESIPVISPIGDTLRESFNHRDANMESAFNVRDSQISAYNDIQQTTANSFSAGAAQMSTLPSFSAAREGIRLGGTARQLSVSTDYDNKIRERQDLVDALMKGHKGFGDHMSQRDIDQVKAYQGEIATYQQDKRTNIANDQQTVKFQLAQNQREEGIYDLGNRTATQVFTMQDSDRRGAAIAEIEGRRQKELASQPDKREDINKKYDAERGSESIRSARLTGYDTQQTTISMIQGQAGILGSQHENLAAGLQSIEAQKQAAALARDQVIDPLKNSTDKDSIQQVANANKLYADKMKELAAAADGLKADFVQTQKSMEGQHQATIQMLLGNSLAGANKATDTKYDALIQQHPELASQYNQQRNDEHAMNAQQKLDFQFGTALGTQAINQQTGQQNLRNQHMGISANVQGDIDSGVDQIEQANYQLKGDENKDARNARIAAIRANTLSMVKGETAQLQYGGRLEQVSAYVTGGDRNNRAFADYKHAMDLGSGAASALDTANKNSDLTANPLNSLPQQTQDMQNKLQQLITQMTQLIGG